MSAPIKNKTAEAYLIEAIERVTSLVEREYTKNLSVRRSSNHDMGCAITDSPNLIAAHAWLSLLGDGLGRIVPILERGCAALEDIAESLDYLAARADGDEAGEVPTSEEQMIIYRALESNYLARGNPPNIKEMDAVLPRFKKLAGTRPGGEVVPTASALDDPAEKISEQERWRRYEVLKEGFLRNNPSATPEEYERAMRLYSDLLGV